MTDVDERKQPILIIEDSAEDYQLVLRALRQCGVTNPIRHFEKGDDALDFLYRSQTFEQSGTSPRPCLILLDLGLPGTGGREVLEVLKNDPSLSRIPVVVLTTSRSEDDIKACYKIGSNSYLQKPLDYASFAAAVQQLKAYWIDTVILPDN